MGKKVVKQKEAVSGRKTPVAIENPDGYLKRHPIWRFGQCDLTNEKWTIRNCQSLYDDIMAKIISYVGMTWAEIQAASGGKKKGTNSHFEYISEMTKEAQKRAAELHLDVDQLFSLRLTGKERLYGVLDEGIFSVIWYDSEHEIYPSSKK